MSDHLPRLPREQLAEGVSVNGELESAIARFAAAVIRSKPVEPLIRELVRLRCAQIHDCRLCGSLRVRDALEQGFDERMQRQIATYEKSDFSPAVKAALRLCDAIIMQPGAVDGALRAELHQYFDDHQVAGLCLDVMKWSQQKALVALRLETPPWQQTTSLSFDENGDPVFGGPAYS